MTEGLSTNRILYAYDSEEEAFPKINALIHPSGSRVIVQMRVPKKKTASGLWLDPSTRDTEYWTTQVGKVVAVGPVAFCDRKTLEPWPEGAWCQPGDYVRVPRYGGDKWTVPAEGFEDEVLVATFNDLEIVGVVPGGWEDALKVKAFI